MIWLPRGSHDASRSRCVTSSSRLSLLLRPAAPSPRRRRRARRPSCAPSARALAAAFIPTRRRAHAKTLHLIVSTCRLLKRPPARVVFSRERGSLHHSDRDPCRRCPQPGLVSRRRNGRVASKSQQSSRRACGHERPQQSVVFAIGHTGTDEWPANTVTW